MSMSDRLAIMRDGAVQQIGTPEEVYDAPTNPFVADFIGDANTFEGTVSKTDDGATLTADGYTLALPDTDVTGEATVVVRPERVTLHRDLEAGLEVRVTNKEYHGSHTRYIAEAPDGRDIHVEADDSSYEIGDEAAISVEEMRVFA